MTTTKKTCSELVGPRKDALIRQTARLQKVAQDGRWDPWDFDSFKDPLAVNTEVVTCFDVLLSTGGPEDGFRIVLNEDGDAIRGEYYYKDWFDGSVTPLSQDEIETLRAVYGI